jgi:hypothetical protein
LQIQRYLNGELDARAMYELELRAQNDPFLMDALAGMETAQGSQQAHLDAIDELINQRVKQGERRVIPMYRYWAAAASILIVLGIGSWWLTRQSPKPGVESNVAQQIPPNKTEVIPPPVITKAPEPQHALPKADHNAPVAINKKTYKIKKHAPAANDDGKTVKDTTTGLIAATQPVSGRNITTPELNPQQPANLSSVLIGRKAQNYSVGNAEKLLQGKVYGKGNTAYFGSTVAKSTDASKVPVPFGSVVVTGRILDAITKEPLTGTKIGTLSDGTLTEADINGNYRVIVKEDATLTYSFISYASQSIKLAPGQMVANINLNTDTRNIADVVIRGYVKRNREQTTGSSYIITGKEVQDNPISNVEQLLQGKVAGLNIQNNTGAPGMRGTVNIRGLSTMPAIDTSFKIVIPEGYREITGTITDAKTGETLPGVTIGMLGRGVTQTAANGRFKAVIPDNVTLLTVMYVGYKAEDIKLDEKSDLKIAIVQQVDTDKIVIRGYTPSSKDAANKKKEPSINCKENLKFKAKFMANIAIAEAYTLGQGINKASAVNDKQMSAALKFIARYALVSIKTDIIKGIAYPDATAFAAEKANWLKWYEDNKCNNLK